MVAVFLVTLYEYSPLFYISVIFLCFVVTATMVLGWFGFDVHVILHNSDKIQSVLPTPEKQMVQVTNPFFLELGSKPASVTDGVWVRPFCLEPSVLTCFWGCEVYALQAALKAHQYGARLSTPQCFQQALNSHYYDNQILQIRSKDWEELFTEISAGQKITDFGPLPRQRYPLVAVLTLTERDTRDSYNILASITVIHVPDEKHPLSACILFQYLLTAQGSIYELKPLFMSADSKEENADTTEAGSSEEADRLNQIGAQWSSEDVIQWSERGKRDCVVCQNATVNRVLLPCRHTCVCDGCVLHFQHCPICRAFIMESFALKTQIKGQ